MAASRRDSSTSEPLSPFSSSSSYASSISAEYAGESKRSPNVDVKDEKTKPKFKPAAVLNVILQGTACHRSQADSQSILTTLHDRLAISPTQSVYLVDGAGAAPSDSEIGKENPTIGKYSVSLRYDSSTGIIHSIKTPTSGGPSKLGGLVLGLGSTQSRDEVVDVVTTMLEAGKAPLQINLIGYSRGADNTRRIANALQAKFGADKALLNVSIFRFDPVPGGGNRKRDKSILEPAIVDESFTILMAHEAKFGFEPQDKTRTVVQDPSKTKSIYRTYAGEHGHTMFMRPLDSKEVGFGAATSLLARDDLLKFLQSRDVEFKPAGLVSTDLIYFPLIQAKVASPTKQEEWTFVENLPRLTPEQRFDLYTVMWFKQYESNGSRSFTQHLEDYISHGYHFFINKEHQELFQQSYPHYFNYYFQQNIAKSTHPQVLADIKKISERTSSLEDLGLENLNLAIDKEVNLANALTQFEYNLSQTNPLGRPDGEYFPVSPECEPDELKQFIDQLNAAANYVKRQTEDLHMVSTHSNYKDAVQLKKMLQTALHVPPPLEISFDPAKLIGHYLYKLKILVYVYISNKPDTDLAALISGLLSPKEHFALRCHEFLVNFRGTHSDISDMLNAEIAKIKYFITSGNFSIASLKENMRAWQGHVKSLIKMSSASYSALAKSIDKFLESENSYTLPSIFSKVKNSVKKLEAAHPLSKEKKGILPKNVPIPQKLLYYVDLLEENSLSHNTTLISALVDDAITEATLTYTGTKEPTFIKELRKLQITLSFYPAMPLDQDALDFIAGYRENFHRFLDTCEPAMAALRAASNLTDAVTSFGLVDTLVSPTGADSKEITIPVTPTTTDANRRFIDLIRQHANFLDVGQREFKDSLEQSRIIHLLLKIYQKAESLAISSTNTFKQKSDNEISASIFYSVLKHYDIFSYQESYQEILTALQKEFRPLEILDEPEVKEQVLGYLKKHESLFADTKQSAPTLHSITESSSPKPRAAVASISLFGSGAAAPLGMEIMEKLIRLTYTQTKQKLQENPIFHVNFLNVQYPLMLNVKTIFNQINLMLTKSASSLPIPSLNAKDHLELNDANRSLKDMSILVQSLMKIYYVLQDDGKGIDIKMTEADAYFEAKVAPRLGR